MSVSASLVVVLMLLASGNPAFLGCLEPFALSTYAIDIYVADVCVSEKPICYTRKLICAPLLKLMNGPLTRTEFHTMKGYVEECGKKKGYDLEMDNFDKLLPIMDNLFLRCSTVQNVLETVNIYPVIFRKLFWCVEKKSGNMAKFKKCLKTGLMT